jgi:hypothetical protein
MTIFDDGKLNRARDLVSEVNAFIDHKMGKVDPPPTRHKTSGAQWADQQPGVGGSNPEGPSLVGPVTVPAGSTYDILIGDEDAFQSVFLDYGYLRNSNIGTGKAMVFSNPTSNNVGGGRLHEDGEAVSELSFIARQNGGLLYVRVTNGDGVNDVELVANVLSLPLLS